MEESLELGSLGNSKTSGSGSEEYHEINDETAFNSLRSHNIPDESLKESDFFVNYKNVKNTKVISKKKQSKKKRKAKNIIDTLCSELTSKPLLTESVICSNDGNNKQHRCLKEDYRRRKPITKGFNVEEGWSQNMNLIAISPTFPSVIENASKKETSLSLKYIEPVQFTELVPISRDEVHRRPQFLDINIHKLHLLYHHDFSLEILLGLKMETFYKKYRSNKNYINDLQKNVVVNRKTRNNLREHLIKISPVKKEEIRFDKTILKYTKIMLELKEKYYEALKVDKKLKHQILSLWGDIETIRLKSERVTTAFHLEITPQELSEDEFNEMWMQKFEEEYTDMLIKLEYEFIDKYLQYKEQKRSGKGKMDIGKPKLQINSEEIKDAVDNIVCSIVTKQNVEIDLRKNEKLITKIINQNFGHRYFFRVFVDNVFVCESDVYYDAKNAYTIKFNDIFSIQLLEKNKNIKITLFENENKISSLKIEVGEIKESIAKVDFKTYNFIYNKTIAPSLNRIGNGYDIKTIAAANKIRLKSSNLFKGTLHTTFKASIKVAWNDKTTSNADQIRSFLNSRTQLNGLFLGKTKPNMELLTELITNIYEKSIETDTQIMNALREICKKNGDKKEVFRNEDNKQNSARLKLLHLRNTGKLANLEHKSIPLVDSQISTDHLSALTSRENINLRYLNFEEQNNMHPIDLKRYIGVKYVMKLNENVRANMEEFLLQKTYKDVVRDFENMSLRNFFTNKPSLNLGATSYINKHQILRECLKDEQEIRVTVMRAHNLLDRTPSVVSEDNISSEDIAGFRMRPLRPFVRIGYRGESYQTPTAVGCHPTWNHTVVIKSKLEPLQCININVYDECKTNIVDSSLEQSYHYRKHASWLGSTQIPLRAVLDAGSLRGAFRITTPPFTFGYEVPNEAKSSSDIIHLLKTNTALILLNITTSLSHLAAQSYSQFQSDNDDLLLKHINTFTSDYLDSFPSRTLTLTFVDSSGTNKAVTEFLQPIPVPDYEYFPKDPKKVEGMSKGSGQSRSSSSRSSRRKSIDGEDVSPFGRGEDSYRKTENQQKTVMDAVIRYVSLIPAYEVLEAHSFTLTGVELLKVLYGSPLDHNILLASFFLYLGIKCYVITGWGLPRGASSYVLVKFHHNQAANVYEEVKKGFWGKNDRSVWYVYDAVAGERFDLREIGCPLKTVSHVFDCENIWVNVQSSQDCGSVSMDLTKSSDWQPVRKIWAQGLSIRFHAYVHVTRFMMIIQVFNKPMFLTKPMENLFSPPSDAEGLRAALETRIKNKIQKWRAHVKTVWNRYCSGLLRETLPHWEYWSFNPTHPKPSPGHRLKQLMVTYKMCGSPLNMPYLNPKSVTSRVKSTALHVTEDPNVEFGLAVEVYAYPNDVLSVWVFLVSIAKIQD